MPPSSNGGGGGGGGGYGKGIEAEIERAFVDMLGGGVGYGVDGGRDGRGEDVEGEGKEDRVSGRSRRIILCSSVEAHVFRDGRHGAAPPSQLPSNSSPSEHSDSDSDSSDGGVPLPLPTPITLTTNTTPPNLTPQQLGRLRAANREKVRQAARRGVAFGFLVQGQGQGEGEGEERRKRVEAVQGGRVVEASFAKGEWGVRWRE